LSLSVLVVILSAAKDPDPLRTAHTARTFLPSSPQRLLNAKSRHRVASGFANRAKKKAARIPPGGLRFSCD
jgi:hypothetical protein